MNWKFLKNKQYENIAIIRNNNICNIGNICVGKRLQPTKHKAKRTTKTRNPDSFSMILLGDPQTYTKFTFNQPIFELMTAQFKIEIQ